MRKVRILIVDDSAVIRRLLADALADEPAIEVVGIAASGRIALAKLTQLRPDLVTLNPEMPGVNVQAMLTDVRKAHPRLQVILFRAQTLRGAVAGSRELAAGASNGAFENIQVGSLKTTVQNIRAELVPKIKTLCGVVELPSAPAIPPGADKRRQDERRTKPVEIVAIGVSIGGPNALTEIIRQLPANFSVPIVVVQHMPPLFTKYLAERMDAASPLAVREAEESEPIRPGQVWLAPGNFHMALEQSAVGVTVRLHQGPPENSCRPAVDVLFRSVAELYGPAALAVVLTGMGQDGLRGCESIRAAGGWIIAQDEASSVVWGMPGAVVATGLADQILPLDHIARELTRLTAVGSGRSMPTLVNSIES